MDGGDFLGEMRQMFESLKQGDSDRKMRTRSQKMVWHLKD